MNVLSLFAAVPVASLLCCVKLCLSYLLLPYPSFWPRARVICIPLTPPPHSRADINNLHLVAFFLQTMWNKSSSNNVQNVYMLHQFWFSLETWWMNHSLTPVIYYILMSSTTYRYNMVQRWFIPCQALPQSPPRPSPHHRCQPWRENTKPHSLSALLFSNARLCTNQKDWGTTCQAENYYSHSQNKIQALVWERVLS